MNMMNCKLRGGTSVFLNWKSTEKNTKILNFLTLIRTLCSVSIQTTVYNSI